MIGHHLLGFFLALSILGSPLRLTAQETTETHLDQISRPEPAGQNRMESWGYSEPNLPPPPKPKGNVGGGEGRIVLKKKNKKTKAASRDDEEELQMENIRRRDDPRVAKPKTTPPRGNVAPQEFEVKTVKTAPEPPPRPIKLVFPPHNSTLSSGIVQFEWDSEKNLAKRKMQLILERISSRERTIHSANILKKRIYVGPGEYRWQVSAPNQREESLWRIFRVIELKSARRPSATDEAQVLEVPAEE